MSGQGISSGCKDRSARSPVRSVPSYATHLQDNQHRYTATAHRETTMIFSGDTYILRQGEIRCDFRPISVIKRLRGWLVSTLVPAEQQG